MNELSVDKTNSKYLTTEQAADLLGRTPGAVRNLVLRRKIPFRKPSGRLVFIRAEIEAWVENAQGITLTEILEKED